jgi:hypothetical protein
MSDTGPLCSVLREAKIDVDSGTSYRLTTRATCARGQWRPGWDNGVMNIDDFTPTNGGSLSRPVLGPHREPVATFTPTRAVHPDELWEPLSRTNDMTRDAPQGAPLGYRPGRSLEHEPLDSAEKAGQHTAQTAFDHVQAAGDIRSALRPGVA